MATIVRNHDSETTSSAARTAVLIPCYNEELTIGPLVRQFRVQLPGAEIYVFDNNSVDRTADEARRAGAIVVREPRQGKGYVVQSMFQKVEADAYILVDGDGTYDPAAVHDLLAPVLRQEADMAVGSRLHLNSNSKFKEVNRRGNKAFVAVLNAIFRVRLTDILSGYRVFSREFVKNIPLFAGGFDIEAELTIKALERGYRIVEVPIHLSPRPEGSFAKIRRVRDGAIIAQMIFALFRDYKPLTFFGSVGLFFLFLAAMALGLRLVQGLVGTDAVTSFPSDLFTFGLFLAAMMMISVGLMLHTTVRRFQELDYQRRIGANGAFSHMPANAFADGSARWAPAPRAARSRRGTRQHSGAVAAGRASDKPLSPRNPGS